MIKLISAFGILSLLLVNCISNESINSKNTKQISTKMMQEKGYKKGTIQFSSQMDKCQYTIKADDIPYLIDPINLEDSLKKDQLKIWFTYQALRMKNRCAEANPVRLKDVVVIEE